MKYLVINEESCFHASSLLKLTLRRSLALNTILAKWKLICFDNIWIFAAQKLIYCGSC